MNRPARGSAAIAASSLQSPSLTSDEAIAFIHDLKILSGMDTETMGTAFAPGRGAIITGGASGIGLATARRLAGIGMRVCIADRDRDALTAAAAELAKLARRGAEDVLSLEVDVSSLADVDRLAETAFGRFGDIAFSMNNAASFQGGDALSDPDGWRQLLEVNVLGVLNGVQRIGRAMIDRGGQGFIV